MQKQLEQSTVLMIFPEFPSSFWDFKVAVEMLGLGAAMPPICLSTIATMLPIKYFDVLSIIDLNVEPLLDEYIEKADIVMLSAMIVQKESLSKIIARVKRFKKTIVVGGPYATTYPEDVIRMGADCLILNEAETTLPAFIEDWLQDCLKQIYDENSVKSRSNVAQTHEGKPLIRETPIPRWDLLKINRYASMSVQFSRGCPFNCEFCNVPALYGHIPRTKTSDQLIAELDSLRKLGWRGSVFIVDDNFIGNINEVRKFLPLLIKWQNWNDHPFSFFTEASLNLANENLKDIRENMVKAGFNEVFCGIESVNVEVLAGMGKSQNRGDIAEKVLTLQRSGLQVMAGFIIGNDDDKPTVFDDIFRFIQSEGIVIAMAGLLTALKGSALYDRLFLEGRLLTESSGDNTHQLDLNFKPKLNEDVLIDGYIDLLDRLYSSRNYYARCKMLRKRSGSTRRPAPLTFSRILAAFRIFHRNMIEDPDWEFVKFILGTLFTAPSNLTTAIEQAVKFVHFQSITKEAVRVHHYPKLVNEQVKIFKKRIGELEGSVDKRLRKINKLEQKICDKVDKMYLSIHPDYRANIKKTPADWRREINICADKHRQYWQAV